MGGFGSGGRRVGAGRKSKRESERKLSGARARTQASDAGAPKAPATAEPVVVMPASLSPLEAEAWLEMAPLATSAGTLVEETALAFRDLCEAVAMLRQIRGQLQIDGLMVSAVQVDEETGARFSVGDPKAHPLLTHERQYRLRVEAGRARFAIAPNGRSIVKTKETDPFAEFDGLRAIPGGKQ